MRSLFFFLLYLLLLHNATAQQKSIDTSFSTYFDRLPAVAASAEIAWKDYWPKTKSTPTKQYAVELQTQLNLLAGKADHQSRLLSTLAKRIEQESSRFDFSKVRSAKDKVLEKAVTDANTAFFAMLDDYSRNINNRFDSAMKQYSGTKLYQQQLAIYQQEIPLLINKTRAMLNKVQQLLRSKGYDKILQQADTKNIYFIQLLETRGILLDRMLKLNEQVEAANMGTAQMVDYCKKNPGSCN